MTAGPLAGLLLLMVGGVWWCLAGPADWTGPALAVLLPTATLLVGWSMVSRQVTEVGPDGIVMTHLPLSARKVRVPRAEVVAIRIHQRDDAGSVGMSRYNDFDFEDPSSRWTVAVLTAGGREVSLSEDLAYWDEARRVADELAAALGSPEVPIQDLPPE